MVSLVWIFDGEFGMTLMVSLVWIFDGEFGMNF